MGVYERLGRESIEALQHLGLLPILSSEKARAWRDKGLATTWFHLPQPPTPRHCWRCLAAVAAAANADADADAEAAADADATADTAADATADAAPHAAAHRSTCRCR